jgi:hypothetical protein
VSALRAWAGVLWLALCTLPPAASGQGLRDRALGWVLGDFRAPLVCTVEGTPRQALRRVRIYPTPHSPRPSVRILFYDLEAPPGTSCGGVSGQEEPNVIGAVDLVFEGRTRPDTGELDFRNAMRRDGGFRFPIVQGRLRVGPAGGPADALATFDYADGTAKVEGVPPGSDAARRLGGFGAHRQLRLELAAEGATPLVFELVELPPR